MVENKTVYKCTSCGGIMEFDVESQCLKCPNCDSTMNIEHNEGSIIEHELTLEDKRKIKVEEKETTTMVCSGCGANIELASNDTGAKCPYCGSSYVLAEKQIESIIPDGVVPFKIDKNEVLVKFRTWIKKRWLAPNELKHLYQHGGFQGIYVPYWTFDADASCYYTAEGGRNREVHYQDEEGNDKVRIEIDWYPVSGHVSNFFDDIQVTASRRYQKGFFRGIQPFNFNELVSYAPEYTSGYLSENYSIDLEEGHREAVSIMNSELSSMSSSDVRRKGYDHVRSVHINPIFSNETYKYLLLPIYSTSYSYKNKNYTVLINGQTGRISGAYPKSWIKITLLIVAIIAVIGLFMYFINQ